MSTAAMTPANQAAAALVCVCGASADQHYAKDHPFMERWAYDPATWHRAARYSRDDLNPATNLYITVEDRLRVSLIVAANVSEVDIVARIQRPDGQVIPMRQQIVPTLINTLQNFDFDLCEGFLLDVSAATPNASVKVGQAFVIAQLIRQSGANAQPSRVLISNYVSTGNVIGWPEGPNQQSVQGNGAVTTTSKANPAAGADFIFTVAAGTRVLVQSLTAVLTTSAAVANRIPHIQVKDNAANIMFDCAASAAQTASLAVRYSFCGGIQPAVSDGSAIMPIPDVMQLPANWSLVTATTGIAAADQWSLIEMNTITWLEP